MKNRLEHFFSENRDQLVAELARLIDRYDVASEPMYELIDGRSIVFRKGQPAFFGVVESGPDAETGDVNLYRVDGTTFDVARVPDVRLNRIFEDTASTPDEEYEAAGDDEIKEMANLLRNLESNIEVTEGTKQELLAKASRFAILKEEPPEFEEGDAVVFLKQLGGRYTVEGMDVQVWRRAVHLVEGTNVFQDFVVQIDEPVEGGIRSVWYTYNAFSGEALMGTSTSYTEGQDWRGENDESEEGEDLDFTEERAKWLLATIFSRLNVAEVRPTVTASRPYPPRYEDYIPPESERAPGMEARRKLMKLVIRQFPIVSPGTANTRVVALAGPDGKTAARLEMTFFVPPLGRRVGLEEKVVEFKWHLPPENGVSQKQVITVFGSGAADAFNYPVSAGKFATESERGYQQAKIDEYVDAVRQVGNAILNAGEMNDLIERLKRNLFTHSV